MRRRAAVPKPPTPRLAPLSERIGVLLRRAQPFAYCDACLADYFVAPLSAAQRAARLVGATDGFSRKLRRCRTCHERYLGSIGRHAPPTPGPGWNGMNPNGLVAAAAIVSGKSMSRS